MHFFGLVIWNFIALASESENKNTWSIFLNVKVKIIWFCNELFFSGFFFWLCWWTKWNFFNSNFSANPLKQSRNSSKLDFRAGWGKLPPKVTVKSKTFIHISIHSQSTSKGTLKSCSLYIVVQPLTCDQSYTWIPDQNLGQDNKQNCFMLGVKYNIVFTGYNNYKTILICRSKFVYQRK